MIDSNLVPVKYDAKAFILAGDALFTVANANTGNYFTFKVQAPEVQRDPADPVHFVKVLSGPDNHADYEMIGMLFSGCKYVHWKKSRFRKVARHRPVTSPDYSRRWREKQGFESPDRPTLKVCSLFASVHFL